MQQSFLSRFNKIKLDLSTRSTTEKLLITLLLVALINSLKFLLKDLIAPSSPFLMFFGLVVICGRYIGFWYAILACMVSGAAAYVFIIYPNNGFKPQQLFAIVIYILECVFIAYITDEFRKALVTV